MVQAFLSRILLNGVYDVLKKRVNEIFSYVKKKNAYKIYSYKEFKEADINFREK